jgi:tetratricopeptide (TPR) repeat protein
LVDPAHDAALAAAAEIFGRARQYRELCQVLLLRAGGAVSPMLARELRVEAAAVLERHLDDAAAARDLYEQVVDEDPGQDEAAEHLLDAYERAGDTRAQARLLERRAAVLEGERRHAALCRLGDLELVDLDEARSALRRFEAVVAEDPTHMDALRGAERALRVLEQYDRLTDNLEQQLRLAVTARQKRELLEQIAAVYAEQFLDHERAAATFERMLELDRTHETALVELARHYRALGRFTDLLRVLERHVELLEEPAKRAGKLVELAGVLERQLNDAERALAAYEAVRELDPNNAAALDALARLRATAGDERAVEAIEALARGAAEPSSRAGYWVRAARWLESRGQLDEAIARYKRALGEADDLDAYSGLREAYLKRGDRSSALELLERQVERVSSPFEQAELWAVIAGLRRELDDVVGAEDAGRHALALDPAQFAARALLGDIAFDAGRVAEAARLYEPVVSSEPPPDSARVHTRYVEALTRQGDRQRALQSAELLAAVASERSDGHRLVAQLAFELGQFERAREANERLIERFGPSLGERERAAALYRWGESLRQLGQASEAATTLERASDLDPEALEPLRALTEVYRSEQRWEELRRVLERRVERETGDALAATLIALGDLAATRFSDPTEAAKRYLAALAERPKDRRVLLKLMELYSESRDWQRLIDIIQELSETANDPTQKARYLHTAARVAGEELADVQRALGLLGDALRYDPKLMAARRDAIDLQRSVGDLDEVEHLLEQTITLASEAGDREQALRLLEELGTLAASRDRIEQAVAAYEGAQRLDPSNAQYAERLAEFYSRDPKRYLEPAADAQEALLRADAYRPEPYRALCELYGGARVPDGLWCACQALTVLGRAQPEEEAFFKKHRRDAPLSSGGRMTDREWTQLMVHPGADPLVTELFALVESCMLAVRGRTLRAFGLATSAALGPDEHPYGLVRWLRESSTLLGIELPLLIHDPRRAGALALLPSRPRAIALASAALNARLPERRAAFVAAAHLVYVRPGLAARYLVPTVPGLKAWLLAALRIVAPRLPIGAELEGPVEEAQKALAEHMSPAVRERLARPVGELLAQGARVDLGRWVRAVDITSDRAGLVVCDDLQTALDIVGDAGDGANSVLAADRKKQLLRWAVSRPYVTLRERLGVSVSR